MNNKEIEYRSLFEENCEGADPDYLGWFETEFNPDDINWDNQEEADAALERLKEEMAEAYLPEAPDESWI